MPSIFYMLSHLLYTSTVPNSIFTILHKGKMVLRPIYGQIYRTKG